VKTSTATREPVKLNKVVIEYTGSSYVCRVFFGTNYYGATPELALEALLFNTTPTITSVTVTQGNRTGTGKTEAEARRNLLTDEERIDAAGEDVYMSVGAHGSRGRTLAEAIKNLAAQIK
jgi:hypothetical protein